MKQKVLKRLGLLALSGIMVAPNVLGETKAEVFPKLSTKDVGKHPTKPPNHANAIKGSGFFDKLFKTVGVAFVMNEIHELIRNMIGNPWYCLGMTRGLLNRANWNGLTSQVLNEHENTGRILEYFQRKTEEYKIENQKEPPHESPQPNKMNMGPMPFESQPPTQTKPIFRGVITPLTDQQIDAECKRGQYFAENHPHLALLILKRFDAMLAMGIDIFRGVKPFDSASPNPNGQQAEGTSFEINAQQNIGSTFIENPEVDTYAVIGNTNPKF